MQIIEIGRQFDILVVLSFGRFSGQSYILCSKQNANLCVQTGWMRQFGKCLLHNLIVCCIALNREKCQPNMWCLQTINNNKTSRFCQFCAGHVCGGSLNNKFMCRRRRRCRWPPPPPPPPPCIRPLRANICFKACSRQQLLLLLLLLWYYFTLRLAWLVAFYSKNPTVQQQNAHRTCWFCAACTRARDPAGLNKRTKWTN